MGSLTGTIDNLKIISQQVKDTLTEISSTCGSVPGSFGDIVNMCDKFPNPDQIPIDSLNVST